MSEDIEAAPCAAVTIFRYRKDIARSLMGLILLILVILLLIGGLGATAAIGAMAQAEAWELYCSFWSS
jgi:hypothetical protein